MKPGTFKKLTYEEALQKARQKPYKARTAKKPKKSKRSIKMALKRLICEQYGLPSLPCKRWGEGKSPTRYDILKGMLWHIFSLYIRLRDKDEPCISCGLMKEGKQAGHFAPAGGNDLELCFSEDNVNGECAECNGDFRGTGWHLIQMRPNLIRKIGEEKVLQIERQESQRRVIKWEEQVLADKIKFYYKEVEKLKANN